MKEKNLICSKIVHEKQWKSVTRNYFKRIREITMVDEKGEKLKCPSYNVDSRNY